MEVHHIDGFTVVGPRNAVQRGKLCNNKFITDVVAI